MRTFDGSAHCVRGIHPSAGTRSGTCISFEIVHNLVRGVLSLLLALQSLVDVRSVGLVARADVDGFPQRLAVPWLDGAAVDHDGGAVVARKGHDDAWHVLVAAGDGDAGVVVLGAGYGFDAVGDDFPGLEGKAHS